MVKKKKINWGKAGVLLTFIIAVCTLFGTILLMPISTDFTEAQKYFVLSLVIFLAFFVYFQFFKDSN